MSIGELLGKPPRPAVLDDAYRGDIRGAPGTIRHGDIGPRRGLLPIPPVLGVHRTVTQIAHDFVVPRLPAGEKTSEVMLPIIAIVGTTVWRLPPLDLPPRARLSPPTRLRLIVPRFYLGFAAGMIFVPIVELAFGIR